MWSQRSFSQPHVPAPRASLGRKQLWGKRFKAERLGVQIKSKDEESC